MGQFFCAESSRQAGLDIISTASTHESYVLIECPTPWEPYDLDSKLVPAELREIAEEVYSDYERFQTRFLLIAEEATKQKEYITLIIFRKDSDIAQSYSKQEFQLADINQTVPIIQAYLAGDQLSTGRVESLTRDILVCTHGSHDKCCAKYGIPFYREALATVAKLALPQVRVWQASHIGGHRFAPTAIDFPTGRYYGYLDAAAFTTILTHTGNIQDFKNVYRGWGILPLPLQILEKNLFLQHGWDWFNYKVTGQIIEQNEEETFNRVELTCETSRGECYGYKADIIEDETSAVYLKGSCSSEKAAKVTQYKVENLVEVNNQE